MARIDQYVAQVGLQAPPMPNTAIDNPMPRALQGLGNSIQDVGGVVEDLQARNDKRNGFAADNAYRKFQVDLDEGLTEAQTSVPADGRGLLDSFKSDVYRQKRDTFLQQLDPKQRQRYELLTDPEKGSDAAEWFSKAANAERDMTYKNAESVWSDTSQQLATGIDQDPENFEAYRAAGLQEIERTPLPAAIREARKKEWNNFAEVAYYNRLAESAPNEAMRQLGADWRRLSDTGRFKLLTSAVETQETGGQADPDKAVSPAGALGRRQIMPGTAREIAVELGDTFVKNMDPEQLGRYVSQPEVNKRYSDYYLAKQLTAFKGDVESALIAYNAGPGVTQKWLGSDKNDAVLPAETRKYKREIMTRMGGGAAPYQVDVSVTRNSDGLWYAPGVKYDLNGAVRDKPCSQDYVARISGVLPRIGSGVGVTITSAGQDAEGPNRTGSHRHDVDGTGHSNTSDFVLTRDGKPVTPTQDPELYARAIEEFAAAGFTGIGHYAWGIHVGGGKPAFWGPDTTGATANGKYAIAYERGREKVNMAMAAPQSGTRASSLTYEQRQKFISNADSTLQQQAKAQNAATAVQKVEVRRDMANDIAATQATGQGITGFDAAKIAQVLGEDDYMVYAEKKELAGRVYGATADLKTMPPDTLNETAARYEPIAGSPNFAADQQVQAAVVKEIERITRLRGTDPAKAAEDMPGVSEAKAAAQQLNDSGQPDPQAVQNYTRMLKEAQVDMGIPPAAIAPVPTSTALQIGRSFASLPTLTTKNRPDVTETIAAQYAIVHQLFGDDADEIITYSLSKYKSMDKDMAGYVTGLMRKIANGGDPFAPAVSEPVVPEGEGFWGGISSAIGDYLTKGSSPISNPTADPEIAQRATEMIRDADDKEAAAAAIKQRYGKEVADTARRNAGAGQ